MRTNYLFYPKSAIFLIACCIFTNLTLSAQVVSPAAGFQQEIGLDISMPLHQYWGASILYKHRIGTPKTNNWQNSQALRGMIGLYRQDNSASGEVFHGDSTVTIDVEGRNNGGFLHAGWEFQATKKRIRVYCGGDLGFRYINATYQTSYVGSINGTSQTPYKTETVSKTTIPQVSVFGGINYFFTPRLSLGLEINMPVAVEFTSSVIVSASSTRSEKSIVMEVGGNDYNPRLLYLSWHFGADKGKDATPPQ